MSSLSSSTDLSANASIKSLRLLWQQQLMPQEKPKLKERIRVMKKNIKQVCEELDDIEKLLRYVLNTRRFLGDQWRHCILQTRFLLQPRASDSSNNSAIVYKYVRQSLIMHIVLINVIMHLIARAAQFCFR